MIDVWDGGRTTASLARFVASEIIDGYGRRVYDEIRESA